MLDNLTFLEEGRFTHINKATREKALELTSSKGDQEKVSAISKFLLSNLEIKSFNLNIFRKRTASEIFESGFSTGCSETALIFIVLSRASGIPAKYVETLLVDWLSGKIQEMPVEGHVFIDVGLNGRWFAYDPLQGFTPNNQYILMGRPYSEVGKGLDFSEVYLKTEGGYSSEPINLQSIEPLKELRKNKLVMSGSAP
jgi:transglutaminase-like putative cysteine protease